MRSILNEIKWAYQRVVRGYDDRVRWGFDSYFLQVIPALKEFCIDYINGESSHLNPERTQIFKKTLDLIYIYESDKESWNTSAQNKLLGYVGEHSDYYWD